MENIVNSEAVEQKYKKWIILLSVVIPLAVASLFGINLQKLGYDVQPLSFLPPIYAGINGITAVVLFTAVWAIKNGKQDLHQKLMKVAIGLSVTFLVMYVAYHMTSISTVYGDADHNGILSVTEREKAGYVRSLYIFILLTHIALSVIIIPFVLFTYVRALSQSFVRHKKLARITYPMWMYVAVTGVIVYWMIRPYYAH